MKEQLVAYLEARGIVGAAETAGLQRRVIINLAARLRSTGERLDFEQAVTELERAVEIALDVIQRDQRGSNEDDFVNVVLAEVANRTKNNDLDGAAQALDHALAELDLAVEQHTLRRDAHAVALRVAMLVALDQPAGRHGCRHSVSGWMRFGKRGRRRASTFLC